MIVNFTFAIIISVVFMVVLPAVLIIFVKNRKHLQFCIKILSIAYFCILCVGVLSKIEFNGNTVLVTVETKSGWFDTNKFSFYSFGTFNILINLYMLLPVGAIGYVCFDENKFLKTTALAFLISLLIETMQFIFPVARSVEFTDIVYNTLSGMIGYLTFYLIGKLKMQQTLN